MKKVIVLALCLPLVTVAQKKSGIVYSEHPAYDVVTESYRVWESGTEEELRALYTEDAKIWGPGDEEPGTMDEEVKGMLWWQKNFDISITNMDPATPDIIKYKGEKGAWTLDWMIWTAINKESGDTVKGPLHTANYVNEEGKIAMTVNYFDRETIGAQIQESFGVHRNGRVFDEHPFIDMLNEMVAAYSEGDLDKLQGYFAEDADFYRLGHDGKYNLEERRAQWEAGVASTSERKLEQSGYPDAIWYARDGGSWVVYSWWWANNTDAETGETTREFLHMTHSFNDEGKVDQEIIYMAN